MKALKIYLVTMPQVSIMYMYIQINSLLFCELIDAYRNACGVEVEKILLIFDHLYVKKIDEEKFVLHIILMIHKHNNKRVLKKITIMHLCCAQNNAAAYVNFIKQNFSNMSPLKCRCLYCIEACTQNISDLSSEMRIHSQ